ncbi:hypothetical protein BY996DRAFT_6415880 [Phakopsora pachyrhizi]|nr:hypothetical protein BY996DRAFT_6415880 [Phakopsora pachyrhizi]
MGTSLLWLFQLSAQVFFLKHAHPLVMPETCPCIPGSLPLWYQLHLLKPPCPFKSYSSLVSLAADPMATRNPCSTTGGRRSPGSMTLDVTTAQTLPPANRIDSTTPSLPPYSEPPTPISISDNLIEEITQYVECGGPPVDFRFQAPSPVLTEADNTESLPSSMDIKINPEATHSIQL